MSAQQKASTPVVGFNHNIPYKGRTFHVQTEDSGAVHAHIMTHIFVGGNILASSKSHYSESARTLSGSELFAEVRKRMEEQHKGMIRSLLNGSHDAEIDKRLGTSVYSPGVLADGQKAPGLLVGGERSEVIAALSSSVDEAAKTPAPASASSPPSAPPISPSSTPSTSPNPSTSKPRAPLAKAVPGAGSKAPAPKTPAVSGQALFADEVMSERRLDEVILQYLATALDGGEGQ